MTETVCTLILYSNTTTANKNRKRGSPLSEEGFQPTNSLIASRVARSLGGRTILKGITLQIFQGEVFGIYGRSGAGKTMLLRVLSGLDAPNSGRVSIQVEEDDRTEWLEAMPAVAMQTPGMGPDLTVQENLTLFVRLWQVPRKKRTGRIARYMELLELTDVRFRRTSDLSYGARQRVELAGALLPESMIVMIDCLIETLPSDLRLSIWRHLQTRAKAGAAIIIATASAKEAAICERIAVLEQGRLEFVGAPEELLKSAGPDLLVVQAARPPLVRDKIKERLSVAVEEREGGLVFTTPDGNAAVREIIPELDSDVSLVYLRRPNLEDVLKEKR